MSALLQAELLKLRTTRTFLALASLAVGASLLLAGLVASLSEPTEDSVLVDVFASDTSAIFIIILAVVGITGEWRHRTITSALLAAPDRARFLAAKAIAFAAAGLVLSVLVSAAVALLGSAILTIRDLPMPAFGELLELFARNAVVAALLGAFGVAIGALVRNQVVAVVGLLVLALVVEPAVIALAPDVGRFAPIGALPTSISGLSTEDTDAGDVDLVAPGLAFLAMLAWILVPLAAGVALLRSRDVD